MEQWRETTHEARDAVIRFISRHFYTQLGTPKKKYNQTSKCEFTICKLRTHLSTLGAVTQQWGRRSDVCRHQYLYKVSLNHTL